MNLLSATMPPAEDTPPGFAFAEVSASERTGSELIGASLYEFEPGNQLWPYHFHAGNEEWAVVVSGTPTELKQRLAGDALHVELENGAVGQAQQVLAGAGARPEQVLGGRVVVARVDNGGKALPSVLAALDDAGIAVASVAVSRPSLDDVYLHFTGRDFDAEDRAR